MAPSRIQILRRVSQVLFLLLFVGLLAFTSLKPSGSSSDVHLSGPVRLFFEWDPLVAITNALAGHALYRGLLWSLLVIVPTILFGRFFCGWICPMGTLQHWIGGLMPSFKRGKTRIESNRYKRWQTVKYVVLIAGLLAACFGSMLIGVLDPFSLLVRSVGLALLPGAQFAARSVLVPLEHSHVAALRSTGAWLDHALRATVLDFRQVHFTQSLVFALLFVTILLLSLRVTRLWCRSICPLGAILGLLSRYSILGLEKNKQACDNCNRCLLHCQGGDDPIGVAKWRKSECLMCMNCVPSCPTHAIQFKLFRPNLNPGEVSAPDLGRRRTVTALAAGAVAVPVMRANTGLGKGRTDTLLRPPGSLDESTFLSRCIRCGECMKVCPNNALQPTVFQAGLEGLWTPTLVPRIGYCEPSCVLCSEVCPTGAIWQITPQEKGWVVGIGKAPAGGAPTGGAPAAGAPIRGGATAEKIAAQPQHTKHNPVRLGTAFYDRGRCLPWAEATQCIVCEEWCPVSPKAIYVEEADVVDSSGTVKRLKQPRVDPSRCVGCGACEYACPLEDRPAVYVTRIGESRSPNSQVVLNRQS